MFWKVLRKVAAGEALRSKIRCPLVYDITEKKDIEAALEKIEIARQKELHHRIKNNLQVISSLLDLTAERFNNRECIQDSEVLKAFKESRDRVISMALIHEELYKGKGFETLNFSPYIEELAENLLQTYAVGNLNINLKMDLDKNAFFDMDTAIPLGIIVNELISNSLKYAFPDRKEGEIRIELHKEENGVCTKSINEDCRITNFVLTVSDNGVDIPENFDMENLDTLGMQLVTSLVDQLDGELELKRDNGTEFAVRFTVTEKEDQTSAPAIIQLIE
ncbi:sensor histidine kinase [Methanosarcina sp.]|uniref:sensor histidine kinase n=1 Tax=Methanosarcina sp. TaxID=2213 RepID=UPI003C7917C5